MVCETAGHISSVVCLPRELDGMPVLCSVFLNSFLDPTLGMVPLMFKVGSPTSVKHFWRCLHRQAKRVSPT